MGEDTSVPIAYPPPFLIHIQFITPPLISQFSILNSQFSIPMSRSLIPLSLILLLASCGGGKSTDSADSLFADLPVLAEKQVVGTDTIVVARFTSLPDPIVLPASQFIDSLRLVHLENSDDALVGPSIVWTTGNRLFVYDYQLGTVKQFTDDGTYIGNIGNRGQGPGEYAVAPYYIDADLAAGRIYLLQTNTNKISSYDLDGRYVGDIPLAFKTPKGYFKIDSKNGTITVAALVFNITPENPVIWTQDFEGNVISRIDRPDLQVVPDFSNEIYASGAANSENIPLSYWYIDPSPDSLYTYSPATNRLTPSFTCDFGTSTPPVHSYKALPRFYTIVTNGDPIQAGEGSYMLPQNQPIVIDRTTLRGAPATLLLDTFGSLQVSNGWNHSPSPGYFTRTLDPGDLADWIERELASNSDLSSEERNRMQKLKESISPDDNTLVIVGRWRQ